MIAGKEMKMAKVELVINGGVNTNLPAQWVSDLENLPSREVSQREYADKTWEEYVLVGTITSLLNSRKTVQRKIDAARKRLKRLTNRLNVIENGWVAA